MFLEPIRLDISYLVIIGSKALWYSSKEIELVTQIQISDKTVCVSLQANA